MWSRSIWHNIISAILLISVLLSASACFRVVVPGSYSGNRSEASSIPTATVTVTVTPPDVNLKSPLLAVTPYASTKQGIVGIWNFDNNVLDSSGSGNNGTIIGGATLTDSTPGFGKALHSGINSYGMRAPDSPSLDISTTLLLETWSRFDSLPDRSPLVSKTDRENTQKSYQLQIGADGHVGLSVWKTQEVTTFLRGDTLLNPGQWYHLAGSYEYLGDGTSVMKVFVDDKLDGKLSDAVGPIFVGTADLTIGKLAGAVDEAHVWNTPYAAYALTATPIVDINQPGTNQTITANITPAVPGVKVHFETLPGSVNYGQSAIISTNNKGVAVWNYTDKNIHEGIDNIRVWIDRDWSGSFEELVDTSVIVKRVWLDNFVTASGNFMDGNRITWTFSGSIGMLGRDMLGEFEIVDHIHQTIYHSTSFNPSNNFMPSNSQWLPGGSLPDNAKIASFGGTYTNNLNASIIDISIWVVDAGEPGANLDRISMRTGTGNFPGVIWLGIPNPNWTSLNSAPFSIAVPISNGDIKVYKTN